MARVFHLRLPDDIIDMVDRVMEGDNITDKIKNYVCSIKISKEMAEKELIHCQERIKTIHKVLENNLFHNSKNILPEELEFLNEAESIVNKDSSFIYGQCDAYNIKFKRNIQPKEFRLLLYEFQDGKTKTNK